MTHAPYYIVVKRSNQALLSFAKVRIVVNGKTIVPLLNDQPVVIPSLDQQLAVVVTDGFHISKPLKLSFTEPSYYSFRVDCMISDPQLFGGLFVLVVLYLLGFFSGIFLLKLLSFMPLLIFIFFYYINRKEFIRLVPARL